MYVKLYVVIKEINAEYTAWGNSSLLKIIVAAWFSPAIRLLWTKLVPIDRAKAAC